MPQIGPLEILVILMVALIVFGPERLPEIARKIGRTANELRRMANEVKDEFQEGLDLDLDDEPTPRRDHPNLRHEPVEPPSGIDHEGMDPDLPRAPAADDAPSDAAADDAEPPERA